jgi:GAF domain-containing protein
VASALDQTFPEDVTALESVARLMEVVGSNATLPAKLNNLALFVERQLHHIRCSIHLVNLATGTLHCGAAPNLPEVYNAAIEGVRFGEGLGSCGTAAARRALVIVADTSTSPLWKDFQHLVREHDLAACWSTPVLSGSGELLGTFAMYYREPHEPTGAELATLRVAAPLAAMVIERHRDMQRVRDSEERFRSAFDSGFHRQGLGRSRWSMAQGQPGSVPLAGLFRGGVAAREFSGAHPCRRFALRSQFHA